jgi:hypothetical protein
MDQDYHPRCPVKGQKYEETARVETDERSMHLDLREIARMIDSYCVYRKKSQTEIGIKLFIRR